MSIASEITRLSGVRSDIFTSITNKGVAVPAGSTFSSCPTLIDSIVTGGGGGDPTSMINPTFTASGYASGYRPFTATQNVIPKYDEIYGTYISGQYSNYVFIQVPMSALSGAGDLTNYNLNLNFQSWNVGGTQSIDIIPNSADLYSNHYSTNKTTNDFTSSGSYSPPLYYLNFNGSDLSLYWDSIQQQSWIATAFTGEYVYIGWPSYQSYENMKGDWNYYVQTGTDVPYPDYPTTTTGYIINAFSGREFWNNLFNLRYSPRIDVSGYKNVSYDNSPEGGIDVITSSTNITAFNISDPPLKRTLTDFANNYNLTNTAYTYDYGTIQTAYSGFEGI